MMSEDSRLSGFFRRLRLPPVVTVLRMEGVIRRAGPLRSGIDSARMEPLIRRAFAPANLAAVALVVNSPGGSPVQSSLVHTRIRQAADRRGVPVLAFAEDVAASGGYWLALAADEIWADPSSLIGSIGVVFRSFGLTEAIARLGVERRIHATGPRKPAFDPFRPQAPEDEAMMDALQADMFETFKDLVRRRRGDRLKGTEEDIFSGAVWSGKAARDLGLVDGLGDIRTVLRQRYGDRVRLAEINRRRGWLQRRLAASAPDDAVERVVGALEDRALWNRYGL